MMDTGATTTQPIGHYEFCDANPAECRYTGTADPVVLTDEAWGFLNAVNRQVNEDVTAVTDQEIYQRPEFWAFPTTEGDCEDFVLLKRRMLAEAGWPLSTLLITMVFQPDGQGHAVLTVRTDRGDLILDNMSEEVRRWTDTPYVYVKRQSERDAGVWVEIATPRVALPVPAPGEELGPIDGPALGDIGG